MPAKPVTFRKVEAGGIVRLRKFLDDPEALLKKMGAILLADSQRAFVQQKFGTEIWPPRYPKQGEPKINVAGALADLSTSSRVKPRRFVDRPALRDTGLLLRSLKDSNRAIRPKGKFVVEVGTSIEYAGIQNEGGISRQTVTDPQKKNLGKFLKTKKGKRYSDKLGFLFQRSEMTTKLKGRRFIGVTPQAEKKIRAIIEEDVKKARDGK